MNNSIMRGVLALVVFGGLMFVLATAKAGGTIGTPGNNYSTQPNHSGGFGGCNKDNSFCWSFDVTLPPAPQPPYHYYPIEVYGDEAQVIVERGHILDRRFSWDSWRFLVKTGWQSWFQFKNKVFDCAVSHREPKQYYCEQWTSQVPW